MNQYDADGGGNERNLFRPGDIVTVDRRAQEQPALPGAAVPSVAVQPTIKPAEQYPSPAAQQTRPELRVSGETPVESVPESQSDSPAMQPTRQGASVLQNGGVAWTASEFVAHNKSASWYAGLSGAAVVIAGIIWLVTRDIVTAVIVMSGIALLGVYASRKPRQESYALDEHGLSIGNRHYSYQDFRSFSLVPEGAFVGIEFAPLKRLATYTTVYYDPADEERILGILTEHLPMEPPRSDMTDRLMRQIHF